MAIEVVRVPVDLIARIKEITPKAVNKWGSRAQMTKACEELAELQVQLCKKLNNSPTTTEQVVDEIADVIIMSLQMRMLFNPDAVDARIKYKLDRLEAALARP